jgi:hypothetical protein
MDRKKITYNAPVWAFEYEPDDQPIWPCHDCLPWHLEVVTDSPEAPVLVREWHAEGCPVWDDEESSDEGPP